MNPDESRESGFDFVIRPARVSDLPVLGRIERAAAALFAEYDVPASVLGDTTPIEELEEARRAGSLWVAASAADQPIGFACAGIVDGHAHLDEVDVDPRHQRRGVGAALVRAVCHWAVEQSLSGVTLTTYRDIPWNAPFYRRLGFIDLGDDELTPALREVVQEEAERGLDPARRTVMRWEPDATADER